MVKYYENMDDSAMLELMEQIRAEDEAYETMFVSDDSFCGCDQCESQWAEYN